MEDQTEFSNLKIAEYGQALGALYAKMYRSADILFGRQYFQYPTESQFPEGTNDPMDYTFRRTFLAGFESVRSPSKGSLVYFLLEGLMRLLLVTLAVSGAVWLGFIFGEDCSPLVFIGYVFVAYVAFVVVGYNVLRVLFVLVLNRVYKRKFNNLMLDYKQYRDSQKKSIAMEETRV